LVPGSKRESNENKLLAMLYKPTKTPDKDRAQLHLVKRTYSDIIDSPAVSLTRGLKEIFVKLQKPEQGLLIKNQIDN